MAIGGPGGVRSRLGGHVRRYCFGWQISTNTLTSPALLLSEINFEQCAMTSRLCMWSWNSVPFTIGTLHVRDRSHGTGAPPDESEDTLGDESPPLYASTDQIKHTKIQTSAPRLAQIIRDARQRKIFSYDSQTRTPPKYLCKPISLVRYQRVPRPAEQCPPWQRLSARRRGERRGSLHISPLTSSAWRVMICALNLRLTGTLGASLALQRTFPVTTRLGSMPDRNSSALSPAHDPRTCSPLRSRRTTEL